jgi:regulatory protein
LKERQPKVLTQIELLEKLRYFCGYQERSKKQVLLKMKALDCPEEWRESLLRSLEEENFLNQDRYKTAFVKGKSTIKGWGPNKIGAHLQFETGENVEVTSLLNPEDFQKAIEKLKKDMEKKLVQLKAKSDPDTIGKLIRFALSRGFSFEDSKTVCKTVMGTKE